MNHQHSSYKTPLERTYTVHPLEILLVCRPVKSPADLAAFTSHYSLRMPSNKFAKRLIKRWKPVFYPTSKLTSTVEELNTEQTREVLARLVLAKKQLTTKMIWEISKCLGVQWKVWEN